MSEFYIIDNLLGEFTDRLDVTIEPFEDEIDFSIQHNNLHYCASEALAEEVEKLPSFDFFILYVAPLLSALANNVNAMGPQVQFQRMVVQPAPDKSYREQLAKDGISIRYTVRKVNKPKIDVRTGVVVEDVFHYQVLVETVAYKVGAPIVDEPQPETD